MTCTNHRIDDERKLREIEGESKYGPIDPVNDPRSFVQEAHEELLDSLNYLEWAMLKGEMGFCKWVLIDRELRFTITRLLAARRIGELVPATPPEVKGKRAHGKELSKFRTTEIPKQRLSEFRKLAEDLSAKIENLLFVIWIQDQRHDYWMKFIKEVRTALEHLKKEIEDGDNVSNSKRSGDHAEAQSTHNLQAFEEEERYSGS